MSEGRGKGANVRSRGGITVEVDEVESQQST